MTMPWRKRNRKRAMVAEMTVRALRVALDRTQERGRGALAIRAVGNEPADPGADDVDRCLDRRLLRDCEGGDPA